MPTPFTPPSVWIILGPIFLLAVFSVVLAVMLRTRERPPDEDWNGPFYSNPDDPALFVPKRYGIGYTLNFSNRWSWVVLLLILAVVAVPVILSLTFMRQLPR